MIKILIIDDEPAAGNVLKLLIERHIPMNKVVRSCSNPREGLSLIESFEPGLLMLDIEMPNMNGFDLLNLAGSWSFDVIFTTAYDKYAIKAIRFSALDYLLKPIDIVDLQNAINRHIIKQELAPRQQEKLVSNLLANLQQKDQTTFKLALSTMEGVSFVEPKDILRCEGENNYTHFHFINNNKAIIVSRTLKEYEEILSDHGFIRIHKSHLVNISHVTRIDKEGTLWLSNGTQLSISRRRREEVLRLMRE